MLSIVLSIRGAVPASRGAPMMGHGRCSPAGLFKAALMLTLRRGRAIGSACRTDLRFGSGYGLATGNRIGIKGSMKRSIHLLAVLGILLGPVSALGLAGPAAAEAKQQSQQQIGQFGNWSAFVDKEKGNKLCYVGSIPEKQEGKYTSRGRTYVLVTIRPKESPLGVVTVEAGYRYRPDSKVRIDIDGQTYELYTRNRKSDGKGDAWAFGDDGDKALVAAMKRGKEMVVKGTSSRGTLTTDTYSLIGFTKAYEAIAKACKRQ